MAWGHHWVRWGLGARAHNSQAADSAADIVLFDLEDAVATENKPLARTLVHAMLASREQGYLDLRGEVVSADVVGARGASCSG